MHLKRIGYLGLAILTRMLKTARNTNIIPHIWKLAKIVPIPKPNKDIDTGTTYRHISLISVFAKIQEKSLLLSITANIQNIPTQHGYKTQHSTVTALHTLNTPSHRGSLDMSKAFNTVNIHTLIRKLLQTMIPGTFIKLIANYIKGRKAYIPYINHTSSQR